MRGKKYKSCLEGFVIFSLYSLPDLQSFFPKWGNFQKIIQTSYAYFRSIMGVLPSPLPQKLPAVGKVWHRL
jgi:hypothetical protein